MKTGPSVPNSEKTKLASPATLPEPAGAQPSELRSTCSAHGDLNLRGGRHMNGM